MPVDTKTKSLDDEEKKYFRKKAVVNLIVETCIIVVSFYFKQYNWGYIFCLSIMVAAFLVIFEKIIRK